MARLMEDPDRTRAELTVGVAEDHQRNGIGTLLVEHMLAYARSRGIGELIGVPGGSDPGPAAPYTARITALPSLRCQCRSDHV